MLLGVTPSGLTGNKTEPSWGGQDYWVVATDASGNKLWDKRYGGFEDDFLLSGTLCKDGGYLLGGIHYPV